MDTRSVLIHNTSLTSPDPSSPRPAVESSPQQPLAADNPVPSQPVALLADLHSNIMNLSRSVQLTAAQIQLLERGLTFIPRPRKIDWEELRRDTYKYHRKIKLIDYYQDSESDQNRTPFVFPSTWEPKLSQVDGKIRRLIQLDNHILTQFIPTADRPDNLTAEERASITELRNNKHIVIKPADKGSKIVIMDNFQYIYEANRQLSDTRYYTPIEGSLQSETQITIRRLLTELYQTKFITAKQRDFLYGSDDPRPRIFYLLPKIHKTPSSWTIPFEVPPGRPIVSDCSSESYNVAQYIDSYLNPISVLHPSYLRDTYDFLQKIKPIAVPSHTYIFTIDIDSLYTNIDTPTGLQTVSKVFQTYPDATRPDQVLLKLLEISLTRNDFIFNDKYYLQIKGTAMGKKFAPAYANIYMSEWEREALQKCPLQPSMYYRFLDDIIGLWPYTLEQFQAFIDILNTHHPSITVKYEIHSTQVNFLDTTVFFQHIDTTRKKLSTKVYFKDTDTHALLHKQSYHPKHTFPGIIKSQIIRFHRISSSTEHFNQATRTLFTVLRKRGYSKRFLRTIKNNTLAGLSPTRSQHTQDSTLSIIATPVLGPISNHNLSISNPNPNLSSYLNLTPTIPNPNLSSYPNLTPTIPNPNPCPNPNLPASIPNHNLSPQPNLTSTSLIPISSPSRLTSSSSIEYLTPQQSRTTSCSTATRCRQRPLSNTAAETDLDRSTTAALVSTQSLVPLDNNLLSGVPENPLSPTTTLIPLITTFSHTLQPLHHSFKQNFSATQDQYPALQSYRIISALRRNKNLSDLLVHSAFSSLPSHTDRPVHTLHFRQRKFINNPHSHMSAPIHNSLSLNTPNIVYIITCTFCQKHYIGETKHPLQVRLKQHLHQISRASSSTTLYTHFQLHPITHLIITGLECGVRWTSGQRKLAEHRWIAKLDTVVPNGLNEKP